MATRAECCLGNTRLKTAFGAVQNASSSLPAGTCELMWSCDGGGHPRVAPNRSVRCQGDKEGTGKIGWGKGTKGAFQGEQRPTETDPSHDNKWRLL